MKRASDTDQAMLGVGGMAKRHENRARIGHSSEARLRYKELEALAFPESTAALQAATTHQSVQMQEQAALIFSRALYSWRLEIEVLVPVRNYHPLRLHAEWRQKTTLRRPQSSDSRCS